jgi:hypothetical protein
MIITEVVVKKKDGYYLYSKDKSRKLGGPYDTMDEVRKRERQVQYFKHRREHLIISSKFVLVDKLLKY